MLINYWNKATVLMVVPDNVIRLSLFQPQRAHFFLRVVSEECSSVGFGKALVGSQHCWGCPCSNYTQINTWIVLS